jgi:hypothetical protein
MVIALLLESGTSFDPHSFGDRRKKLHLRRHRGGRLVPGKLLEVDRIANEGILFVAPCQGANTNGWAAYRLLGRDEGCERKHISFIA